MNIRRLSYGLLLTLATTLVAACGGETPPAEQPPQPSGAPSGEAATGPAPAGSGTPEASASGSAAVEPVPVPPAKAGKDKWVGKFVQDFSGEVKDAFEADAKKKFAKEKDTKKYDEAAKKAAEAVAVNVIENTADTHTFTSKGKVVHKVKFEVGKDEPTALTIKLGKDEATKKDLKGAEVAITFTDDNTFTMKDPTAKDPKKAQTLVFKSQ
jgi:hypothetical protein